MKEFYGKLTLKEQKNRGSIGGLEPKFWIDPTRMSLVLQSLMWLKWRSCQKSLQVNWGR